MQISCTKEERLLFEKISYVCKKNQVEAYIIGGFVRDKLLQRKTKDIDIVCIGDGILLANEVAKLSTENIQVHIFKTYGTAQLKINGFEIEFVGARKESYVHTSRNPTVETGTLEDDQNRRDFTINALAISLNKDTFGSLLDPFNGIHDLDAKIIKTPLDADITFSDDPLRMMRAIRFATQLQFNISDTTFEAIKRNAARIEIITQERITEELIKILSTKKPSIGFDLLYKSGLLKLIFPQLVELAGAEFIDGKGHKDNFYHTLQVVDNICHYTDNIWLRWAALLHDIAKPATKKFDNKLGWTFHGHEWLGAKMVPKIFKQLRLPLHDTMKYVQKLVLLHLRPISLTKENISDSALRRLLVDAGNDIDDLMLLCHSDITSKNPQKVTKYKENYELVKQRLQEVEEKDKLRNWKPPITGEIIMQTFNLPAGKIVGTIKEEIKEAILEGIIENTYDAAYNYMLLVAPKHL